MTDLLIDTDIFMDHIRGARLIRRGRDQLSYSIVTRTELFAGGTAQESDIRKLLSAFLEVPIDAPIAERAGRLRRDTRMELADALIAATALEHRLTLLTRNRRDFDQVHGLKMRSPA